MLSTVDRVRLENEGEDKLDLHRWGYDMGWSVIQADIITCLMGASKFES